MLIFFLLPLNITYGEILIKYSSNSTEPIKCSHKSENNMQKYDFYEPVQI